MTKTEFLEQLTSALNRSKIPDAADVLEEYEQHFAFKLADGFSEEEIAAKLGDPAGIAAQFAVETERKGGRGSRMVARVGLCFTGLAACIFFVLLAAWGVVLAAFSLGSAAAAVSLIARINPWSLLPPMPYASAIIYGAALAAMAVLAAAGCVWFAAFLRQMIRVYGRFQYNTLAAAGNGPVLPSLAVYPRFQGKTKRRLRRVVLISLSVLAASFVLGLAVSMISAGSLEFWHTWKWFGYAA